MRTRWTPAVANLLLIVLSAGILILGPSPSQAATLRPDPAPVVPDASPEARSLLSYFADIYGKQTLSGQQKGWRNTTNGLCFELDYIQSNTGKLPAILGLDVSDVTLGGAPGTTNKHVVVNDALDWHRRNGIVMICWHWHAPTGKRAFYTKDTDFDLRQGLIEGTPENAGVLRDIDLVAEELKLLRDAHVPVLWRPLHEANGRWFWWGAQGAEPCARLWRLMFDRLTTYHHLNNLIWVFSPGASIDLADWYPGDAYVDIIGQDHYPMDGNNRPAKDVFDELVVFGGGTKLVGMSENGPIPNPDGIVKEKADWLFFVTWAGSILTEKNTKEQLRAAFNHPRVANLADLPDLKKYPFKPAGDPVRLGFPVPPQNVALDGLRRRPLIVSVEDESGRSVREGRFDVTLTLAGPSKGKLRGSLTQPTVNGIATFADLQIGQTAGKYRLIASAKGLRSGKSAAFEVGPGKGIIREWWLDSQSIQLSQLARMSITPSGREPLLKALEAPFKPVTNYSARLRGWLLPPASGTYKFWIANQGASEFWLSPDASPANRIRIATVTSTTPYSKWPHTNEAESEPVRLAAGKRYYLEILHKLQSGPANLAVRWRLPDGTEQRPIPAERLLPFEFKEPPAKRTQDASSF